MYSIVIISCLSKPFFCSKIREHNPKLNTGLALGFFFKGKVTVSNITSGFFYHFALWIFFLCQKPYHYAR